MEGSIGDRNRHNVFCSAAGWPCPIGCESWSLCAGDAFPNLPGACPAICPVHGTGQTTYTSEPAPPKKAFANG